MIIYKLKHTCIIVYITFIFMCASSVLFAETSCNSDNQSSDKNKSNRADDAEKNKSASNKTVLGSTKATTEANEPISAELHQLLNQIEEASAKLKTFQADMLFTQKQLIQETLTIRKGKTYYKVDKKNVKARVQFVDYLQCDLDDEDRGKPIEFQEDIAFDGMWFTHRNERVQSIRKWQVSRKPRDVEAFRLGRGEIPLPFAIKKADVLKEFKIKKLKEKKDDPKKTVHVKLTPKKKSVYAKEYLWMELWVGQKNFVPQKMRYEKDNQEITTITWSKIKIDKPLNDKVFDLKKGGKDWDVEIKQL